MPYDFVNNIRLRGIVRSFGISDILSAAEGLKSKTIEKFTLTEYSMGGLHTKACFIF